MKKRRGTNNGKINARYERSVEKLPGGGGSGQV